MPHPLIMEKFKVMTEIAVNGKLLKWIVAANAANVSGQSLST